MNGHYLSLLAAVLCLGCCAGAHAEDDGAPTERPQPNVEPKQPDDQTPENHRLMQQLHLGYALARYSREVGSAEGLLLATEILDGARAQTLEVAPMEVVDWPEREVVEGGEVEEMSREALLAAARGVTEDRRLAKRIDAASAAEPRVTMGAVGGPRSSCISARGYSTHTYQLDFVGGQDAMVSVDGDHTSDLDAYVFDEAGHMIDWDMRSIDAGSLAWKPHWTGTFFVRVKNRGAHSNHYCISVN
jgi:hypothetical protein